MNRTLLLLLSIAALLNQPVVGQPSYEAAPPSLEVVEDASIRRELYRQRTDEMIAWRAALGTENMGMATIAAKLRLQEDLEECSNRVIALMENPGSGPFWMFPSACVAFMGRDLLSQEALASIREAWRVAFQLRGDTENHFAMYYTSLYLMSELYPNEPGSSWYTGKSSSENLAESKEYLIHWMDLMTTVGQGEFNPTHYIGEYAIPMLFLASWAKDPEMQLRGKMTLDWLFADLAINTLNGVLRGPNARVGDTSVVERWNCLSSMFSWLHFGNCPPPRGYGGWGIYFAVAADHYELPEVIYRIATDRKGSFTQRDLKRSRHRWRYSEVDKAPIYKTNYITDEYAVGSYQGGMADPIQTHVWDVTWAEPDPRGIHPTLFSVHPYSSSKGMQMYFTVRPDTMVKAVSAEGKPSYDAPDKLVGSSPYEQVFQDLDTVVALYDIPAGTRFPQINGFFSKDLRNVTEDESGWIFAQGGEAYLAYYPLAEYDWIPHLTYRRIPSNGNGYQYERVDTGGKVLVSPHLKNGTIVQAASSAEFQDFAAFQAAIRDLPLEISLEPEPTVKMRTLRGKNIICAYGDAPIVNGDSIDYTDWKLFEGPYLNAEKNSRKLTITHGRLQRILDFDTLTVSDSILPD